MDVSVELKRKGGEILDRLIEIRETQANLEAQMSALDDKVISIYEPEYEPASGVAGAIAKIALVNPDRCPIAVCGPLHPGRFSFPMLQ